MQDYIAAGQFCGREQLLEAQTTVRPGTILVFMKPPPYQGGLERVIPSSSCVVNAYTSNHDLIKLEIRRPSGRFDVPQLARLDQNFGQTGSHCWTEPTKRFSGSRLMDRAVSLDSLHSGLTP
jgi:hypothetical protein